jgi:formylglycine-generating enzyme required for sulfatase activity
MGSDRSQRVGADRSQTVEPDETPPHQVTITRPFLLGAYEVTQSRYENVMDGANPSRFRRAGNENNPVEGVTWLGAVTFCNRLSVREHLPEYYTIDTKTVTVHDVAGTGYRLPTEAEWEYARATAS